MGNRQSVNNRDNYAKRWGREKKTRQRCVTPKRKLLLLLGLGCALCLSTTARADDATYAPAPNYFNPQNRSWGFDFETDRDWNKIPDFWQSVSEAGFPSYIHGRLDNKIFYSGKHSLGFSLDRGKAALETRRIPVDISASYEVTAMVRQANAPATKAFMQMRFFDENNQHLSSQSTPLRAFKEEFMPFELRVVQVPPKAKTMSLRLGLDSNDIRGGLWFDTIYIRRQPRIVFESKRFALYGPEEPVIFDVNVGGVNPMSGYEMQIDVEDFQKQPLASVSRPLRINSEGQAKRRVAFPVTSSGFFRGRGTLLLRGKEISHSDFFFTKIGYTTPALGSHGSYGLILDIDDDPALMVPLIKESQVSKVKLLIDLDKVNPSAAGSDIHLDYAPLIDSLAELDVKMTGSFSSSSVLSNSDVANDALPGLLLKSLAGTGANKAHFERILASYNTHINLWQVGWEVPQMIINSNEFSEELRELQNRIDSFSFQAPLLLPLTLSYNPQPPYWPSRAYFVPASLSPGALEQEIIEIKKRPGLAEFTVEATTGNNRFMAQVSDFIKKAILIQKHNYDSIYGWPLQHPQTTFLGEHNAAGPLFSAYITLQKMLSGASYFDELTRGPQTMLFFTINDDYILSAWNDGGAINDEIILGEKITKIDLMGKVAQTPMRGDKQVLQLETIPHFFTGINGPLLKTRMSVKLAPEHLPVKMDMAFQKQKLLLTNHFKETVDVRIRPRYPNGWTVRPALIPLDLAPGQQTTVEFIISPPLNSREGSYITDFDIDVFAEREFNITIKKRFELKSPLAQMAEYHLRGRGSEIEVSQLITNNTNKTRDIISFLKVPGQPEITRDIGQLKPGTSKRRNYRLPAHEAMGKQVVIGVRERNGTLYNNKSLKIEL